jgi:hypothetical protein
VSGERRTPPEPPPSVEAVARLKAKRMRRDGGELRRDVTEARHARSYLELELDRRLVEAEADEASS